MNEVVTARVIAALSNPPSGNFLMLAQLLERLNDLAPWEVTEAVTDLIRDEKVEVLPGGELKVRNTWASIDLAIAFLRSGQACARQGELRGAQKWLHSALPEVTLALEIISVLLPKPEPEIEPSAEDRERILRVLLRGPRTVEEVVTAVTGVGNPFAEDLEEQDRRRVATCTATISALVSSRELVRTSNPPDAAHHDLLERGEVRQ